MHGSPEEELIFLCNLFGSCSKRSQGAGGNISVKDNNNLYIKASGVRLTSVKKGYGYVICDLSGVLKQFHDNCETLESTVLFGAPQKPSMETFMHLLGFQYIVHFHPSYICKFLCSKEAPGIFTKQNFPNSLFIHYVKPGFELAKTILPNWNGETVLFLENHGIVILGDRIESLVEKYSRIVKKTEELTNIQDIASSIEIEYFLTKHFQCVVKPIYSINKLPTKFSAITPDHFLFLQTSLFINSNELDEDICLWKTKYNTFPTFLQVNSHIYTLGKSWEECQNREEYLLSYIEISGPSTTTISFSEQNKLLECPKEQFRLQK